MEMMEIILSVVSLLMVNFGVKLGRAAYYIKQAIVIVVKYRDAKKDGYLNKEEKVELFDAIHVYMMDCWAVLKGLFPNKSK